MWPLMSLYRINKVASAKVIKYNKMQPFDIIIIWQNYVIRKYILNFIHIYDSENSSHNIICFLHYNVFVSNKLVSSVGQNKCYMSFT